MDTWLGTDDIAKNVDEDQKQCRPEYKALGTASLI